MLPGRSGYFVPNSESLRAPTAKVTPAAPTRYCQALCFAVHGEAASFRTPSMN